MKDWKEMLETHINSGFPTAFAVHPMERKHAEQIFKLAWQSEDDATKAVLDHAEQIMTNHNFPPDRQFKLREEILAFGREFDHGF